MKLIRTIAFIGALVLPVAPVMAVGSTAAAADVAPDALPSEWLRSAPVMPLMGTTARSLEARFSDVLNVRDYGAKCDGVTDDTVAIQNAINVATGHAPTGSGAWLAYQVSAFASLTGIGQNPNGSGHVHLPGGACLISAPLVATMQTNSAFAFDGEGTANTQLVSTAAGDGLDINYAANAGGNDAAHAGTYLGQAFRIKGIAFESQFIGTNPGIAINITGIPVTNANNFPNSLISDVDMENRLGWIDHNSGWAVGVKATDVGFLFLNRVRGLDHRGFGYAMTGFQFRATFAAGEIVCSDCGQFGGLNFADINGQNIQGVWFDRPYALVTNTGISWLATLAQGNGSLNVSGASITAGVADIHTQNIGTVFLQNNFWYQAAQTTGHNYYGVFLENVDWTSETGDEIVALAAGSQGAGFTSYGVKINAGVSGPGVYDGQPSIISSTSVSGADIGFSGQGGALTIQGGTCYASTTCTQDAYTGSDSRFHPLFLNMRDTNGNLIADAGQGAIVHASVQHYFAGELEIGMPGIPNAGAPTGTTGRIDWHSTPSSSLATILDFDVEQYVDGSGSVSGKGSMNFINAGGLNSTGPIFDGSPVAAGIVAGGVVKAADLTSGLIVVCATSSTVIASGTVTLPPNPKAKQVFKLAAECGGITSLSLTGGTSTLGAVPPVIGAASTISSSTPMTFLYDGDRSEWTRW